MDTRETLMRSFQEAATRYRAQGETARAEGCERIAQDMADEIQTADLAEIEARTHGPGCLVHGKTSRNPSKSQS